MKSLPFLLLFLFMACSNPKNEGIKKEKNISYDYEVLYGYQGKKNFKNDKYRYKISFDTLYILIESGFENDLITITSNKKCVLKEKVSTNHSSGLAKEIKFGNIADLKNICFRINSGPLITIELIKKEHNIIGIRKQKHKISVVFYKKIPLFD